MQPKWKDKAKAMVREYIAVCQQECYDDAQIIDVLADRWNPSAMVISSETTLMTKKADKTCPALSQIERVRGFFIFKQQALKHLST